MRDQAPTAGRLEAGAWSVPLSDIEPDPAVIAAATEALASGWWSMGPRVEAFEQAFAALCGVEHALAVANGTAALHAALVAAGCGPGDEVILPSLTFVAAANVVLATGARPVLCDVTSEHDLNLDPHDVGAALTPKTRAVIVLHYGGHPCDVAAISDVVGPAGVALIEDAAHAPGADLNGRPAGSLGLAGCFSFFANKNLPIGEGGMLVTSDAELASAARRFRSHGMTTLTWDRHRGHAGSYDVVAPGLNLRLDEVRAAVGLVQLRRLEERNAQRGALVERYRRNLHGVAGLIVPFAPRADSTSAHHLAVVVLPTGSDRDEIRATLGRAGVQTSVHYPPIHRFAAYRELAGRALPRTDSIASRLLTLPLYAHLDPADVDAVSELLLGTLGA